MFFPFSILSDSISIVLSTVVHDIISFFISSLLKNILSLEPCWGMLQYKKNVNSASPFSCSFRIIVLDSLAFIN